MFDDEYFMKEALEQAKIAFANGEIPVGAVIVMNGKVIAKAFNMKDNIKMVTKHAELIAIEEASKIVNDWRLNGATIYVTMEPCPMCASAIQQSRIARIVYGCSSNLSKNTEIIHSILQSSEFNHQVDVSKNVLSGDCANIIRTFFRAKR